MKRLLPLLFALLPSCAYLPRPTVAPVKTLVAGNPASKELVVFLPGRWSLPQEFGNEGILTIAGETWPGARFAIPDLHLGYYKGQSAALRLHEDVILPARQAGVHTIRLVGISMGGLGALIHEIEHPGAVDEIQLISPFLGEGEAVAEITRAGSLDNWDPGTVAEDDFSRRLWLALREKREGRDKLPPIRLACGSEDRLADSSRLFAREFLSADGQTWLPGGHDWETWRKLFRLLQDAP